MHSYEKSLIKRTSQFVSKDPNETSGNVGWISPSNIAIVKYWGKYSGQIPANPSLSITLSEARSKTRMAFVYDEKQSEITVNFKFNGREEKAFKKRIKDYLISLEVFMPWIHKTSFSIESENSFPHSSGIASSASALSSIALGLCEIEEKIIGISDPEFFRKASFFARLGSGSASRSLFPGMAVWGFSSSYKDSTDEYAVPVKDIHPDFHNMRDSILIIESGRKKVSSSTGHELMKTNPYAKLRFEAAEDNMQKLCSVTKAGDIGEFIDIMENEALSLHAMMMTSKPGFILMKPNTVNAIEKIREYRFSTGNSVGFTLDAGANVHVIYPDKDKEEVSSFIESALKPLCENNKVIHDRMGHGPEKLSHASG